VKVAFTFKNPEIIRDNDMTTIKIIHLHQDVIPYLDSFIDVCKSYCYSVSITKHLLADLDILDHFSDRVQIH